MTAFSSQSSQATRKSGCLAHPTEASKLTAKRLVSEIQDQMVARRSRRAPAHSNRSVNLPAQGASDPVSPCPSEAPPSAERSADVPDLPSNVDAGSHHPSAGYHFEKLTGAMHRDHTPSHRRSVRAVSPTAPYGSSEHQHGYAKHQYGSSITDHHMAATPSSNSAATCTSSRGRTSVDTHMHLLGPTPVSHCNPTSSPETSVTLPRDLIIQMSQHLSTPLNSIPGDVTAPSGTRLSGTAAIEAPPGTTPTPPVAPASNHASLPRPRMSIFRRMVLHLPSPPLPTSGLRSRRKFSPVIRPPTINA